jgi:hypothetical protein
MVKGKTKDGFEYEIDMENVEDMRFVEALAEADEGSPRALREVLNRMLGEEQKERLYEFCQDEKGRVPLESVKGVITEIFEAAGEEIKN